MASFPDFVDSVNFQYPPNYWFHKDRERRFACFRFFLASLIFNFFLIEGFTKKRLRLSSLNKPSLLS